MKAASISRRRLEEIFSEKVADPCPSHGTYECSIKAIGNISDSNH